MKLMITTGLYPPEIGGPATYTVLLEKELPKRGYEVSVLPFRRSRHLPRFIRHLHFSFLVLREGRKVDIFFAQDVVSVGLPTWLAAKLMRKKFYVRVPGDYAWEQATQLYGVSDSIDDFQTKKYIPLVQLLRSIQTMVTKYSDGVVTPSDYFKKLVNGWGVPVDKIHTIYNGIDLDFKAEKIEKPSAKTIITAGRLVPWKGFAVVISLLVDLPDWRLVILGTGPEEQNLRTLVKELGLEGRVTWAGQVLREEVFGWYAASDVFVLNTGFESFSYQVVEAMASGIPIITTNVGSLPELITNEVEGVLVEVDDKEVLLKQIKSVETEKEVWMRRTELAKQKAKRFSLASTMEKLDGLFKKELL